MHVEYLSANKNLQMLFQSLVSCVFGARSRLKKRLDTLRNTKPSNNPLFKTVIYVSGEVGARHELI